MRSLRNSRLRWLDLTADLRPSQSAEQPTALRGLGHSGNLSSRLERRRPPIQLSRGVLPVLIEVIPIPHIQLLLLERLLCGSDSSKGRGVLR